PDPNESRPPPATVPLPASAALIPIPQTIPRSDRPPPNWFGTPAPFLASSGGAPSALRIPSWPASPDACPRSREYLRSPPRARDIPLAVARSGNTWPSPTAAQTATPSLPAGHNLRRAADSASTCRVYLDAPPA